MPPRPAIIAAMLVAATMLLAPIRPAPAQHPPLGITLPDSFDVLSEPRVRAGIEAMEDWKAKHDGVSDAAILRRHGFADHADFQRVMSGVFVAYGILLRGGKDVVGRELDAMLASRELAIQAARTQRTPAEVDAMRQDLDRDRKGAATIRAMPDENLRLVERYRARLDKLVPQD
jgi:hypothetical protein